MNIEDILRKELLELRRKEVEKTGVLTLLCRLMELLPLRLGVKQTCEELVGILLEESDFEYCSIALWNAEMKRLDTVACLELSELLQEKVGSACQQDLKSRCGQDVAGRVLESGEPMFIEDTQDQSLPLDRSVALDAGCLVCLPLQDLGVLVMSASRPGEFSKEKRRTWALMGSVIGQLISAALMSERLCDANRFLEHEVHLKTRALENRNHELLHANRTLEKIIDHVPESICLLDANGTLVRINRSMVKMQGGDASAAIGSSPAVFFQDPEAFGDLMADVTKSDQKLLLDVFMTGPEGENHKVDVFLTRLPDEEGATKGYLLVIYDMAEKKALSEQLLRTEKLAALGTMAGGVAHDFNNMLMRILGNTQLLMLQAGDETLRGRLENIASAVQDAALTLKRLQTFAGKNGEGQGNVGVVDVAEIVNEVVEFTRPRWKTSLEKHGVTVDVKLDVTPGCPARVSASDLREALANIVLNAVDAMPAGGTLMITSGCDGDRVWIEVSDTGVGMSEEVIRKAFDPFFSTKGVGNSGLGLSVSWNLINRHDGDIVVASQPGKGSTFRVSLPKGRVEADVSSKSRAPRESKSGRVLLVDDDQEILRLLRDMIRMSGHRVIATADAGEALDFIENEEFDLVFTDMGMPVVSGWEIAKKVKKKAPRVPVVLITGWGSQYEAEDLTGQGIDLVLPKPLGYDKLKGVLKRFL